MKGQDKGVKEREKKKGQPHHPDVPSTAQKGKQ